MIKELVIEQIGKLVYNVYLIFNHFLKKSLNLKNQNWKCGQQIKFLEYKKSK